MEFLHESDHAKFHFRTIDEIVRKAGELGLTIPVSENLEVLGEPVKLSWAEIPNSLGIHAMEGCDGTRGGGPGELTYRRYRRFASGGAGLLWGEATAVVEEGRANRRQLWIRDENLGEFRTLRQEMRDAARSVSPDHRPVTVVQLTHSGRYSKPRGKAQPVIAHHSPYLDPAHGLPADYPLITDGELDALQDKYVQAARLARDAGFDAVDVKACHGYLVYELLGAFTRENSKYGGSFENRTRFLREVCARIREEVPGIAVVTRLTVYDATPYPYGFGMATDGSLRPDLSEPIQLIRMLRGLGVELINVATGNPYYNPHVERPFDTPTAGAYVPREHPLANIGENMRIIREISKAVPEVKTVFSGISWLRHFIPQVAAGLKSEGYCDIIGVGRTAFACPHFARDILEKGRLNPTEQCIACSSCTQIMRDGGRTGCPVRDPEIYGPIYIAGRLKDPDYVRQLAAKCRDCSAPTCQEGCPAGVDVPAFVQAIARGEDRKAYEVLRRANALPETCAYVCPADEQCEGRCVQRTLECSSVPIKALQRYVSEKARLEGWTGVELPVQTSGHSVGIIGAGPAGIACAVRLLELGHSVTIYDSSKSVGGTAAAVIPEDRLCSNVMVDEINSILGQIPEDRLKWERNVAVGSDHNLDMLLERHDAVFVGAGLQAAASLLDDEARRVGWRSHAASESDSVATAGVIDALAFLRQAKQGLISSLKGSVAVIGGGNTAMDAAATAARLGADDVYVIYRRSYAQMPAWPSERQKALDLGVHFLMLQQPVGYAFDSSGTLVGVRIVRTGLGAPDASGRRSPQPMDGTEYLLPVDLVIEAIGQRASESLQEALAGVEFSRGLIKTKEGTHETSRRGVFAGGDVVSGGDTVARAVAHGYAAAVEIDEFLKRLSQQPQTQSV
jgi:NADPH-dependent glutamate synthase beta subunit-like oxidoreductase/2,4-dienoyl-CoA reductase-like NADH-dependent reductase (Old Yellow Enzyme family)